MSERRLFYVGLSLNFNVYSIAYIKIDLPPSERTADMKTTNEPFGKLLPAARGTVAENNTTERHLRGTVIARKLRIPPPQ